MDGHVTVLFLMNESRFRGSRAAKPRNLLYELPGVALRAPL
jgi:hypothetical protein